MVVLVRGVYQIKTNQPNYANWWQVISSRSSTLKGCDLGTTWGECPRVRANNCSSNPAVWYHRHNNLSAAQQKLKMAEISLWQCASIYFPLDMVAVRANVFIFCLFFFYFRLYDLTSESYVSSNNFMRINMKHKCPYSYLVNADTDRFERDNLI